MNSSPAPNPWSFIIPLNISDPEGLPVGSGSARVRVDVEGVPTAFYETCTVSGGVCQISFDVPGTSNRATVSIERPEDIVVSPPVLTTPGPYTVNR